MTEAKKTLLKALSLRELKKAAWDLFSVCIRLKNADRKGYVKCVSCGRIRHWQDQMSAGHWPTLAGRSNAVLFCEEAVWPQCVQCNIFKHGNPAGYDLFMTEKYSPKKLKELKKLSHATKIYEKKDLINLMSTWEQELKKIK